MRVFTTFFFGPLHDAIAVKSIPCNHYCAVTLVTCHLQGKVENENTKWTSPVDRRDSTMELEVVTAELRS